jgi:hypothetical protein
MAFDYAEYCVAIADRPRLHGAVRGLTANASPGHSGSVAEPLGERVADGWPMTRTRLAALTSTRDLIELV